MEFFVDHAITATSIYPALSVALSPAELEIIQSAVLFHTMPPSADGIPALEPSLRATNQRLHDALLPSSNHHEDVHLSKKWGSEGYLLRLTFENLLHIENSLNFCHKWIEPWEFAILIGGEEQAKQMMSDLAAFTYDVVERYPS